VREQRLVPRRRERDHAPRNRPLDVGDWPPLRRQDHLFESRSGLRERVYYAGPAFGSSPLTEVWKHPAAAGTLAGGVALLRRMSR
jgi:hypothetical protein